MIGKKILNSDQNHDHKKTLSACPLHQMPRLERLDLSYNNLQFLDSATLASLSHLVVLKVSWLSMNFEIRKSVIENIWFLITSILRRTIINYLAFLLQLDNFAIWRWIFFFSDHPQYHHCTKALSGHNHHLHHQSCPKLGVKPAEQWTCPESLFPFTIIQI